MENFIFYAPTKIFFGKDQIKALGGEIKNYGSNILLVYGKDSIKKNGIYDQIVKELNDKNIKFSELSGVDPNPRITTVVKGADICRKNNIDFILAAGGGSVIDCAKAISFAALYDGDPWDLWAKKTDVVKTLPVGAVLTISATASEMNQNSVITNEMTLEKKGKGHPLFIPKFSILDPSYTFTVSPYQTAAGIADTMAHVFEYYFSDYDSAYIQDEMEEAVMRTCVKYGPSAFSKPDNYEARSNLMWASSMALNGVTSRGKLFDGFLHSTEHALSAIYDITHGAGLAILAPHWFNYILDKKNIQRFARFAKKIWAVEGNDDIETAKKGIIKLTDFYKSLKLPVYLHEAGIDGKRFDEIADKALQGDSTLGIFRKLDKKDIINILKNAL